MDKNKFSFKKILIDYWQVGKHYPVAFWGTFIFWSLGVTASSVVIPVYYKKITDAVALGNVQDTFHFIWVAFFIMIFFTIMFRIGDYFQINFQLNSIRDLHNVGLGRLLKHSHGFFANQFSGGLVTKLKRYTGSFEIIHDIITFQFLFSFIQIVGIIFVLFNTAWQLGTFFLVWFIIFIITVISMLPKKIRLNLEASSADSRTGGMLADIISNVMNIKIFSAFNFEKRFFGSIVYDSFLKKSRSWHYGNTQNWVQGGMLFIMQFGAVFLTAYLWNQGKVTTGVFVLVITYVLRLYDRLWDLGRAITKLMEASTEANEVIELFETPIDVRDPQNPEPLKMKSGNISFSNISFKYQDGSSVFEDFSLEIPSGQKVGIVGRSGAGKSTVTKLLLRFSDVDAGEILIDGQNIKNVTQDDLRSAITYVPQESLIFHRSIRENIAYGKTDATDLEITDVVKKAHADEFIAKLQSGYDTLVGERGVKLSGGERQRVAIARAMLKDAPILMLDEATSSLDSENESFIQDALDKLMHGKTAIVIAHRLSTIQKVDRIIVLDNGKIVEDGTHTELVEKSGIYSMLWEHQSNGFLVDDEE